MAKMENYKLADRFWSKVDKNGPLPVTNPELGPCWLWTACCWKSGYGRLFVCKKEGKPIIDATHRVAYELIKGPIPVELEIDHLCRVKHA
jgi:hypothetical protein